MCVFAVLHALSSLLCVPKVGCFWRGCSSVGRGAGGQQLGGQEVVSCTVGVYPPYFEHALHGGALRIGSLCMACPVWGAEVGWLWRRGGGCTAGSITLSSRGLFRLCLDLVVGLGVLHALVLVCCQLGGQYKAVSYVPIQPQPCGTGLCLR